MKNKFCETRNIKRERLSYNKATSRTKKRAIILAIGAVSTVAGVQASSMVSNRVTADTNTTFQVNVVESLSVSITTPTEGPSGAISTFLRNAVGIEVAANSGNGFTASMYSKDSTNLINSTSGNSETMPTLSNSSTRNDFPANYWGYSLGEYTLDGVAQSSYTLNGKSYGETVSGNNSSNYYPLVSTSASPITIIDGVTGNKKSGSQNIYFGAKANTAQASGTYAGTVVISVVTGTIDSSTNPITPTNPATDNTGSNNPSYATNYGTSGNEGWTTYTTTSTDTSGEVATNTTTTEVSDGDTRSSYQAPAGVIENTYSSISNNTPLATGLAVTAAVAASSGYMFFIAANRRERDEDEEEA